MKQKIVKKSSGLSFSIPFFPLQMKIHAEKRKEDDRERVCGETKTKNGRVVPRTSNSRRGKNFIAFFTSSEVDSLFVKLQQKVV